jgi:Pyruvate/2-oxoglutarate dehydrogenase complex, dehydrogenase (E1) component, eukaryotic type, alpha subunit
MAQVAPGEHELRRVIDENREVDGVGEPQLLDLYRSMVLLRTYDERSLVYHRQGRIGTYAMFWNHEAMQAGAAYALADGDWIFPSYRESAIGLLAGSRRRRCCSGGAAIPTAGGTRGVQRRVDLRADRDAGAARGRARVGEEAEGRVDRRARLLRRRRDE